MRNDANVLSDASHPEKIRYESAPLQVVVESSFWAGISWHIWLEPSRIEHSCSTAGVEYPDVD